MGVLTVTHARCRTCRGVAPVVDRLVKKMSLESQYEAVKFFRVNFKENKKLALRERVFALSTQLN